MTILNYLKRAVPIGLLFVSSLSWAVPIGIIDSGTDLKHRELVNRAWTNPGTTAGYVNDIHGWNFAENNNQIIDYSYLGKFSKDVPKYFEVQLRVLEGNATDEDKKWMEAKKKDTAFIKELMTFGNFVHGTHVAAIASKTADQAQIMAAKIIPTEVKPGPAGTFSTILAPISALFSPLEGMIDDFLMNLALGFIAGQQTQLLTKVGEYVNSTQMRVANCSFGTSSTQARMIVGIIAKQLFKKDLTEAETEKYAKYFMQQILEKGASFVNSAKNTLFVMAAGNDGKDNDQYPVYPANLKMSNTISVAATRGYDRLASFSNYGATQVEIAAPGVGIVSAIPGDEYLPLSGTSQATPFIVNLAGKIMDINPKLNGVDVKKILMQTVDKKPMLAGRVVSGGIANPERALKAADYTLALGVDAAIQKARTEVADVKTPSMSSRFSRVDEDKTENDGEAIALPSPFELSQ
jgi:subtilisin family serine protease